MKKLTIFLLTLIPIYVSAIETSATSSILMDMNSGRILHEKNIHAVRSVASISKIMTAIIAIESGKLDDIVVIGDEINSSYGSGIYIKQGEELTLRDLVYGLMLRSGNDAALAIANYVGGSIEEFVKLMNKKSKELKMFNTTFNNPSGLDQEKGNYSTAYDMALLASYAMKNDEYKKITSTKKYVLNTNKNNYIWKNKNKLLSTYKYTTGGKTGFTEIAKRTLVTTASKNNINLVAVTLNDGNDWEDHKNLFEYGFNNYTNLDLLKKGKIKLYNEKYYEDYDLYIKNNFNYLIGNDEEDSLIVFGIVFGIITNKTEVINSTIIDSSKISLDMLIKIFPVLSLWMGLTKIAEKSGLLNQLSLKLSPLLSKLFPEIPKAHESLGLIASNVVANIFGLGSAATPFGLKAMESLQKLNKNKKTASRSMITFLVLNTSGLTIIPTTIISLRMMHGSSNPTIIVSACILSTLASTIGGIIIDKILARRFKN